MSRKKLRTKYNVEIIRAKDGFSIAKSKKTELYGLLNNNTGEIIIPFEYKFLDADFSKSELITAENIDGLYGFINKKNETIIPFHFEYTTNFSNGFAYTSRFVEENNLGIEYQGVIDEKGNKIFPIEYEEIYIHQKQNCVLVKKESKWGILTLKKEQILPLEFEKIEIFGIGNSTLYTCDKNSQIGVFDIYINKFIIPIELDDIEESFYLTKGYREYGYFIFTKNKLQSLVRIEHNEILFLTEYIYDFIDHINSLEDRVRINQNGLWGISNIEGEIIIPCKYDKVDYPDNGRIKAIKAEKEYIFNLSGDLIKC
ncbi:WG repeat-containing protein [Chryseobacterium sp. SIMBA_038]|uniref:WG repeat-containing protein n=2 Tax=Pseudomonadati TaxID=3379134 RepID=UPI00397C5B8C